MDKRPKNEGPGGNPGSAPELDELLNPNWKPEGKGPQKKKRRPPGRRGGPGQPDFQPIPVAEAIPSNKEEPQERGEPIAPEIEALETEVQEGELDVINAGGDPKDQAEAHAAGDEAVAEAQRVELLKEAKRVFIEQEIPKFEVASVLLALERSNLESWSQRASGVVQGKREKETLKRLVDAYDAYLGQSIDHLQSLTGLTASGLPNTGDEFEAFYSDALERKRRNKSFTITKRENLNSFVRDHLKGVPPFNVKDDQEKVWKTPAPEPPAPDTGPEPVEPPPENETSPEPEPAPELPPPVSPAEAAVITEVLETPEEERPGLWRRLMGMGFMVQEFKGAVLGAACRGARKIFGGEKGGQRWVDRFLDSATESFDKVRKQAYDHRQELYRTGGVLREGMSVATGVGNALLWYRMVSGVMGVGKFFISPLSWVTRGAMLTSRGGEILKETRFKSQELMDGKVSEEGKRIQGYIETLDIEILKLSDEIEAKGEANAMDLIVRKADLMKNREDYLLQLQSHTLEAGTRLDEDQAMEEAMAIYEKATKGGTMPLSSMALQRAYRENLAANTLKLLEQDGPRGIAQSVARKHLNRSVRKIAEQVATIDESSLTPEEKEAQKEAVLKKHEDFLADLEHFVTRCGMVDTLSYAGRLTQVFGKRVSMAMALETLVEGSIHLAHVIQETDFDALARNGGFALQSTAEVIRDEYRQVYSHVFELGTEARYSVMDSVHRMMYELNVSPSDAGRTLSDIMSGKLGDQSLLKHLFALGQNTGNRLEDVSPNMTVEAYMHQSLEYTLNTNGSMGTLPADQLGSVMSSIIKHTEGSYDTSGLSSLNVDHRPGDSMWNLLRQRLDHAGVFTSPSGEAIPLAEQNRIIFGLEQELLEKGEDPKFLEAMNLTTFNIVHDHGQLNLLPLLAHSDVPGVAEHFTGGAGLESEIHYDDEALQRMDNPFVRLWVMEHPEEAISDQRLEDLNRVYNEGFDIHEHGAFIREISNRIDGKLHEIFGLGDSSGTMPDWERLKATQASDLMNSTSEKDPGLAALRDYLKDLRYLTGESPDTGGIFSRGESVEDFVVRANNILLIEEIN